MEEVIKTSNFIHDFIDEDLKEGVYDHVQTRFPPEPNGYLHIGHAKAICIDFSTAEKYGGVCNLRLDDTNPQKEDTEYIEAIKEDIEWLGFKWEKCLYASSYFDFLYECALILIDKGLAYVDDLTADEMREYRGTLTEAGKESPYRNRSVEENRELFRRMTEGEFANGEKVLRAKIDMASPNLNMRDPVIYRISHVSHHQTGDKWCVYPMYDFAHPLSDAREGVTHSLCSLEFENHRPLYNWFVEKAGFPAPRPRQIEFARLNITNMLMSKRYLKKLVDEKFVRGWDDPRMPTIMGLKNRGVPPEALKKFCADVGVAKAYSVVSQAQLDSCIRDNLNENAERAMAVLDPVKLTITNYSGEENISFDKNPVKSELGSRDIKFTGTVYIERDDFSLNPPPKYKRLQKGGNVRLKGAYIVRCDEVKLGTNGEPEEILCTYFPETRSGWDKPTDIKAKGVIQWVDAKYGKSVEFRQYEPLLKDEQYPDQDYAERLNADSEKVFFGKAEPYIAECDDGKPFQLMRAGYYKKSTDGGLVLSEIVSLKDNFNK